MESEQTKQSVEISLFDLQETEKKENQRKARKKKQQEYFQRSEVKARIKAQKESRDASKRIKKMDEDQHVVCKKIGHTIHYATRHPEYYFRCMRCEASYSKKELDGFKENFCPCCHYKLRQRKTILQKRKLYGISTN